ncbi:MAG: hypothetical protein LBU05_01045 [Bifidobacteriaceae bacterium]|jgi:hypothetical protein|nr:hypothetical protein [Bifidobacteriaceae bacterium]
MTASPPSRAEVAALAERLKDAVPDGLLNHFADDGDQIRFAEGRIASVAEISQALVALPGKQGEAVRILLGHGDYRNWPAHDRRGGFAKLAVKTGGWDAARRTEQKHSLTAVADEWSRRFGRAPAPLEPFTVLLHDNEIYYPDELPGNIRHVHRRILRANTAGVSRYRLPYVRSYPGDFDASHLKFESLCSARLTLGEFLRLRVGDNSQLEFAVTLEFAPLAAGEEIELRFVEWRRLTASMIPQGRVQNQGVSAFSAIVEVRMTIFFNPGLKPVELWEFDDVTSEQAHTYRPAGSRRVPLADDLSIARTWQHPRRGLVTGVGFRWPGRPSAGTGRAQFPKSHAATTLPGDD